MKMPSAPVSGHEQGRAPVTYVVEPIYETIGPFSEGLALAATGGKVGYIDVGGAVVIDMQFDGAGRGKNEGEVGDHEKPDEAIGRIRP